MAKVIKYGDTSGIETGQFKQAPVGLYYAKVASIEQKNSKNSDEPMVEVVFELTKDANGKKLKEQFGRIWYYAPLDVEANWARRLKDLITAFGLKSKGGNLGSIEGKEAMVRLREDTDLNGDYRPTIGKVMKPQVADEDEDEEDEEVEDGNLDEMSRTELKRYIKDEELEIRVTTKMSDDDIRAAIQELIEEDEEEDEDEDEEEDEEDIEDEADEDEEDEDNYDDMSLAELRSELKNRELESKGKRAVLIARLRTDDVEEPV